MTATELLREFIRIDYSDSETGDCCICGGYAIDEPKPDGWSWEHVYGHRHEPGCLWVQAHQLLGVDLPAPHTTMENL